MVNNLRSVLLSTLFVTATGCLASGSAGFGIGGSTRTAPPPPSGGQVVVQGETGDPAGSSYAGPAGPMTGGPQNTAAPDDAEPRWDDLSFAVREYTGNYYGPWTFSKFTTFKVGQACWEKMPQKDSAVVHHSSYYIREVHELAKKWTNEDWDKIESQRSDHKKDRKLVEPMMDAFAQRFHLTIAIEGDDCEIGRDAWWMKYWYSLGEAFSQYPSQNGKMFITMNVSAAARDIKVTVDDTGTVYTLTVPRDFEAKDWDDKIAKPFRKNAKTI